MLFFHQKKRTQKKFNHGVWVGGENMTLIIMLPFLNYELFVIHFYTVNYGNNSLFLHNDCSHFTLVFFGKVSHRPSHMILKISWNRAPTHLLDKEVSTLSKSCRSWSYISLSTVIGSRGRCVPKLGPIRVLLFYLLSLRNKEFLFLLDFML